jgi:hypothetical protein
MNALSKTQNTEVSNNSKMKELMEAAPQLLMSIVENLHPKFLNIADAVFSMATEINTYSTMILCTGFKVAKGENPPHYYESVSFSVESNDPKEIDTHVSRGQLNTLIRTMCHIIEAGNLSFSELLGEGVVDAEFFNELDVISRFRMYNEVISENLDLIYERIQSGLLEADKIGAQTGRRDVTITSHEDLVPAIAKIYMQVLAGKSRIIRPEYFFDEGEWDIMCIIAALNVHFYGEIVEG